MALPQGRWDVEFGPEEMASGVSESRPRAGLLFETAGPFDKFRAGSSTAALTMVL